MGRVSFTCAALVSAALVSAAFLLSACGFRPLYAVPENGAQVTAELAAISIDPITERPGYQVREDLQDLLRAASDGAIAPRYGLDIGVEARRRPAAIEQDASVTRFNVVLNARYALRRLADGTLLNEGVSRGVAAYNVVDSEFATVVAQEDAEARAARLIAEDIGLQLSLFFDQAAAEEVLAETRQP